MPHLVCNQFNRFLERWWRYLSLGAGLELKANRIRRQHDWQRRGPIGVISITTTPPLDPGAGVFMAVREIRRPPASGRCEKRVSSCVDYVHLAVAVGSAFISETAGRGCREPLAPPPLTPFELAVFCNKRQAKPSWGWISLAGISSYGPGRAVLNYSHLAIQPGPRLVHRQPGSGSWPLESPPRWDEWLAGS